jgi:hypothetical protein
VQLGQALSTRPDILPNAYCMELAKLQVRSSKGGDSVGFGISFKVRIWKVLEYDN